MNTNQPNLAADLMNLDTHTPAGRADYDRALQSLFDRKLAPADYAKLSLMLLGGLAGATLCLSLAITEPASLPTRTRVAFLLLSILGLTWASLAAHLFRRGSIHSATHGTLVATLSFSFSLLVTAATAIVSLTHPATPPGLILLPLLPLTLSTTLLILHHLRQSELRLRRDLLESEYRLSHQ